MERFQKISREEFSQKYGVDELSKLPEISKRRTGIQQIGRGLAASAEGAALGLSKLSPGRLFMSKEMKQAVDEKISGIAPEAETKLERGAKVAGDIAQFFIPGPAGKTKEVAKMGSLASRVLGRAGGARFLAGEAVKDIGVSTLQQPGQAEGEALSPLAEGVLGAAGNVLLPNIITQSKKLFRQSVKNSANRIPATISRDTANGLDVLEANMELIEAPTGSRTPQIVSGADNASPNVSTSARRAEAEVLTPKVSIMEKLGGIDPDLKQTLQSAGPEITQEYIDVVKTRNKIANFQDGTPVPTALAHATGYVDEATEALAKKLGDQGSDIGQFRNKIATYKASSDQIKQVTSSFDSALSRYNLALNKQNKIVPVRGKISRAGAAEINTLQRMYDNLLTVSQAPNVENLIEARVAFDELVNFASKEPTFNKKIVQDVSKATRSSIADVNRQIVGKSEAAKLQRYTEMIDALSDLTSYTDRRAGAEFILKRVLSERDRETREILQRVKEETGIDLFEHATLARVTTDFMANQRQKGLFRQEITSAGGDIAAILSGDKMGVLQRIIQRGLDAVTDQEEIIRRASMPSD